MKLALCLEFSIGERGGTSVIVETLLRGLVQHGHEVVLVSPDTEDSLRASGAGQLVRKHILWQPRHRPSIADARKLACQLADSGVDLIHFHFGGNYGWGNRFPFHCPIYYLRHSGIPCVSSAHLVVSLTHGYSDPRWPLWYKLLRLPLAWWGKMQQVRCVRREITDSRQDCEKLKRWYRPFSSRFTYIYHSRLPAVPMLDKSRIREPVVLNVGHIAWRKGQVVLAEAFAKIAANYSEWRLEFVGPDTGDGTVQRIRDIALSSGLCERMQILGKRLDAMELMKRAAIYVQPSFYEGLPLALQEAMHSGCACICSRIDGNVELIQDAKTGFFFEPGSAMQLGHLLEKTMSDEALRIKFGQAAAMSINELGITVEAMVKRHLELYETVIAGN